MDDWPGLVLQDKGMVMTARGCWGGRRGVGWCWYDKEIAQQCRDSTAKNSVLVLLIQFPSCNFTKLIALLCLLSFSGFAIYFRSDDKVLLPAAIVYFIFGMNFTKKMQDFCKENAAS